MKNRSRSFTGSSAGSFFGSMAGASSSAGSFSRFFSVFCACVTVLVLLAGTIARASEPYTATTMRLLRYEGTVEIEDPSGKQLPVMENARLTSGEAMKTGEASSASVGLDKGRIVTLDALSRVEFEKKAGALSMNLTEGKIFLDVSEKLDANETMDIKTSTMVVGIRGTIVYASNDPVTDADAVDLKSVDLKGLAPEKGSIIRISQLGVLEGTAQITYTDNAGREQALSVDAGLKAVVPEYSEDAEGIPAPKVEPITQEDLQGFVLNQITADDSVYKRVDEACESLDLNGLSGIYTADGDWTWDSPVTLVAQSASKYYDGQPLTRTSDILVNGLPNIFTVKAGAGGSRTDAGESDNPVSNYTIYNKAGQDVTRHFTNIQTVSGTLLIIPAPLTIHTGTAEKVYDGTPLTDKEAYVTFYKGSDNREVPWRNTSYVVTESTGSVSYDNQTLYGICGTIWVNAANPLTGERREIRLKAGQKLSVFLSDQDGKQSIELKIENLTINDLPEELLRLYGDNEALLAQACKDTGWDIELLKKRIEALPETPSGTATIEQGGLMIRESESDRLMQNLTNVRITIDTEITDYNNRALGSEEAHYTGLSVDESIKVTPTGSQTNAGSSINTYTIDWGSADRGNYEVSEDLGTLTVTAASATVTTGSAQKAYDGTPLTNSEASISGLVNGETASVTATGSITNVGSTANTYSIRWGSADSGNYSVYEDLGTLRVTAPVATVTLTAASAEKTYDGTPLTDSTFTVEGLPAGYTATATVSGSQTDAGSSDNTVTSFKIYNASGTDVTGQLKEATTVKGTLTVYPAPAEVSTGSATKEYDGSALTSSEASITGIVSADEGQVTVTSTGSITDIGTAENTYSIDWGSANSNNYTLSETLGTLEVTANDTEITFTAGSDSKVYDGNELTDSTVTVEGLPSGFSTVTETSGSRTDVGTSANTVSFYHIIKDGADEGEADVTACFTNIKTVDGTLEVTPAAATVTTDSATKKYDGTPLNGSDLPGSGASITGLASTDETQVTVTATGSITDIGTAENTYSIDWGSANSSNYTLSENLGTLEVTANDTEITFTAGSDSKVYDGNELTDSTVTVEGLPSGFTVNATLSGSRTDVGTSANTVSAYSVIKDEDGTDVTECFTNIKTVDGTLEVTPAAATVTTDSATKKYDGTPLNGSDLPGSGASISGIVSADAGQVTVASTGSITGVGTAENTYSIDWGSANSSNYTLSENLGTLEVTANDTEITFTAGSGSKVYDGYELVNRTVTVEGLPSGFSTVTETSGSQTDVGTSANTLAFYHITKDGAGEGEADVTAYFTNIKTVDGTLEVTPAAATVTTDSAEKKYDGTPLNGSDLPDSGASITGLAGTDESQVTVTATGSITDIGTAENTYSIDWGSTKSSNYTLSENLGTLEITANDTEITFTSASAEKVYDGTALIAHDVTVEGLPDGLTYKCTAGNTFGVVGAGTYENYFDDIEYSFKDEGGNTVVGWRNAEIYDAEGNDVTNHFTNLNFVTGTLTIKPAELVVKTGSDEKTYDGTALTNSEASVTGAVSADEGQISVTANGTITDAGTESNTYTISWGSANSGNYTVSEQLGILTVNKLPVEFNMFFPKEVIDDVETDPTFVYDGSAHSPEWSSAYYEGMGDGLDPNDWNVDGDDYSFTFLLPGGGKLQLTGSGYSNAGTHTFEPAASFLEGSAGNYELSFVDNSIVIEPVELVLISNDTYAVTSDVYISEYGLKVQVNNLESDYYEVVTTGENEWRISFEWGDKIDVSKILIKDGNTFSITPIYDVVSGDPANYDIETVDQEGTMTEPIYIDPEDLYGSILISKASSLLAPTTEEEADAEDDADADAGADTDADADAEDTGSGEESGEVSGQDSSGEGSIEGSSGEGSSGEGSIENSTGSTDGGSSDEKISADPTASEQTQDADEELKEDSQKEDPQAEQPQAAEPQEEETEAEEPQEEASQDEQPQAAEAQEEEAEAEETQEEAQEDAQEDASLEEDSQEE